MNFKICILILALLALADACPCKHKKHHKHHHHHKRHYSGEEECTTTPKCTTTTKCAGPTTTTRTTTMAPVTTTTPASYFPAGPARAIAIISGSFNNTPVIGQISFLQNALNAPLQINVNVAGLEANVLLGLHVHANGINSTNNTLRCGSAGLHFNPYLVNHGNISDSVRHVGDYGNVATDNSGIINVTFYDNLSQLYGTNGVIGRTIVLHQGQDDLGRKKNNSQSLITGNSGARLACGVIGII